MNRVHTQDDVVNLLGIVLDLGHPDDVDEEDLYDMVEEWFCEKSDGETSVAALTEVFIKLLPYITVADLPLEKEQHKGFGFNGVWYMSVPVDTRPPLEDNGDRPEDDNDQH